MLSLSNLWNPSSVKKSIKQNDLLNFIRNISTNFCFVPFYFLLCFYVVPCKILSVFQEKKGNKTRVTEWTKVKQCFPLFWFRDESHQYHSCDSKRIQKDERVGRSGTLDLFIKSILKKR